MKSPSILNNISDEEGDRTASDQAAQARDAGTLIIRNHLNNHVQHNPGASSDYIPWIATLHPENADITIDHRFFIPGNPWWTIYEETKNNNVPYATAVPIVEGGENPPQDGQRPQSPRTKALMRCNPVDLMIGFICVLGSILMTFVIEKVAFVFYIIAYVSYKSAKGFEGCSSHVISGIMSAWFMMFYHLFHLIDSIFLVCSVIVTELLAMIGWVLGVMFGGLLVANKRHQYIRVVCHHLRWAFRGRPFMNNPPRSLCYQRAVVEGNHNTIGVDVDAEQITVAAPVILDEEVCKT